jgi:hypothetical protein
MHVILYSLKKWTKKNKNIHIVHDTETFGDNNTMDIVTSVGKGKKNKANKILIL